MSVNVLVLSESREQIPDFLPEDVNVLVSPLNKSVKNTVKSEKPCLIIFDLLESNREKDAVKLIKYVKASGLSACYLLALTPTHQQHVLFAAGIDEVLTKQDFSDALTLRLQNLVKVLVSSQEVISRQNCQTQLLVSVNHFSQFRQPLSALVGEFAKNLSRFCSSEKTFLVTRKKQKYFQQITESEPVMDIDSPDVQNLLDKLVSSSNDRQPDINLLIDAEQQQQLSQQLAIAPEAALIFPLVVFDQPLYTVVCFIKEEDMDGISVAQIEVMKEAAVQLRILLERRIAESRLKSQYQRLKETLSELNSTKEQLVHTEKMAAVGKLAAGIAHEINNPLSFVLSNLEPLDDYLSTMVKLLVMHDDLLKNLDESMAETTKAMKSQIEDEQQQLDMEFVMEDIHAIVDNSKDGLIRVRDIISDLTSFSRQQPLEKQQVDIAELIDECTRLLKYEVPKSIQLQTTSDAGLSAEIHKGFVQQILTNLVKNASHALQDADVTDAKITINVHYKDQWLLIKVTDNGPGIPESMQSSIFEPFFTTKAAGEGTGLGLSVSYNLAKKMGGSLSLTSEQNKTEFVLSLPVN